MVTHEQIKDLAARIVAEFRPLRVVLFGSQATATAREGSDVDLLVVLNFEGPAYEKAAEIRATLPATFAIDLVARTPEDLARRLTVGDPVAHKAIKTGRVIYPAAA